MFGIVMTKFVISISVLEFLDLSPQLALMSCAYFLANAEGNVRFGVVHN